MYNLIIHRVRTFFRDQRHLQQTNHRGMFKYCMIYDQFVSPLEGASDRVVMRIQCLKSHDNLTSESTQPNLNAILFWKNSNNNKLQTTRTVTMSTMPNSIIMLKGFRKITSKTKHSLNFWNPS